MGTRADFYVGKGKDGEWLGSIAWDGFPGDMPAGIVEAASADDFRHAVSDFLATRDDATLPEQGWPWPWNDSGTTDYSYWHFAGQTMASSFGGGLFACNQDEPEDDSGLEVISMPDMSAKKKVAVAGTNRSGVIVFGR